MTWQLSARCNAYDPELFFDPHVKAERRAKSICSKCPVRSECLAAALAFRTEFGVWGGMNAKERTTLLRRRPLAIGA